MRPPPPRLLLDRGSALAVLSQLLFCGAGLLSAPLPAAADLAFQTAPSGLQWADAKAGSGAPVRAGQRVNIDYVMSTTGARYGAKIDSTVDRQARTKYRL
jgi:hypothetical protein